MTGQFTLLSLLLTRDMDWASWGPDLSLTLCPPKLKLALNINSAQLAAYLTWLVSRGYISVSGKGRGWIKIKLLGVARGLLRSASCLPAAEQGRGQVKASQASPLVPATPSRGPRKKRNK